MATKNKRKEPKKFYLFIDDNTEYFYLSEDKKAVARELEAHLDDNDMEDSEIRVFEAFELHFDVEKKSQVSIGSVRRQ